MHQTIRSGRVSVSIRRGLGSLYFYARDWQQAQLHLRRALAMNPVSTESMTVLAQSLLFGGKAGEAEAVVRDGLLLAPDDTSLLAIQGRILVAQGRMAEGEAVAERMKSMRTHRYVSPTDQAKLAIARELASEKSKIAAKKAKDAAQTANAYAHDEPWQIAGAALAVGVLVGLLLGSRR